MVVAVMNCSLLAQANRQKGGEGVREEKKRKAETSPQDT